MISSLLNSKILTSFKFIPTPDFCFSLAPYPLTAGLIGAGYGRIGQLILSPEKQMTPLAYGICFEMGYQIKSCFYLLSRTFHFHINNLNKKKFEQETVFFHRIQEFYFKAEILQTGFFQKYDRLFSEYFHIRSYEQVHSSSLFEASWAEICRHRIGKTLKIAVINSFSLSLSYRLGHCIGLLLPYPPLSLLALLVQTIAFELFLTPPLFYFYQRLKCHFEKSSQEKGITASFSKISLIFLNYTMNLIF